MNQYVGIPFAKHSCWSLCQKVYAEQFGVKLPNVGDQMVLGVVDVPEPEEGCLVRVRRVQPLAEHWGVFFSGYVLHAQNPTSVAVPVKRFMQSHPDVQFLRVMQ
jgi:cell wall-associated NlpC family hydrolase